MDSPFIELLPDLQRVPGHHAELPALEAIIHGIGRSFVRLVVARDVNEALLDFGMGELVRSLWASVMQFCN